LGGAVSSPVCLPSCLPFCFFILFGILSPSMSLSCGQNFVPIFQLAFRIVFQHGGAKSERRISNSLVKTYDNSLWGLCWCKLQPVARAGSPPNVWG
jgi:hypothetical protein